MPEPELTIESHNNGIWVATDIRLGRMAAGATRARALERLVKAYAAWVHVRAREAL